MRMHLLKNKKALSTVVTTLIILVVSVLLATIVTLYAVNVTTTRVQEEALFLTKQHVWYNTSGWAQAAIVITNTGGRDVVIDKITVRGQDCVWNKTYAWRADDVVVSNDLQVTSTEITGTSFNITVQGEPRNFTQVQDDLTLKSGWTIAIYAMNPGSIAINDVGIPVGITIFTANAQYYKETNVEAAQ